MIALSTFAACAAEDRVAEPIQPNVLAERIAAGAAPVILDVRSPEEFAEGHVPGARNVPYDALADRLGELAIAPSTEVVAYCQSGRRAGIAERVLRDAGFTNVHDLSGHWQGWRAAGLPVEKPARN